MGLELFWVDAWALHRECIGTYRQSQGGKKGNWFGCFMPQILSFQAHMQAALKIHLRENYQSHFHNFQKVHGPVDASRGRRVWRVIEHPYRCLRLSEAQGGAGVRWAHEPQIGNELCIAYLRLKEERWGYFTVNRFGVHFWHFFWNIKPAVQLK